MNRTHPPNWRVATWFLAAALATALIVVTVTSTLQGRHAGDSYTDCLATKLHQLCD